MNRIFTKVSGVLVALTLSGAALGVASAAPAGATGPTTVVVGNGDIAPNGPWSLEPSSGTGTYSFASGPATPPGGVGSLAMGIASGQHEWLNNYAYGVCAGGPACNSYGSMTPIANIDTLGYSTYRASGSTYPTLNVEVYSTGVGGYTTLVFLPTAGLVTNGTWQTWNALNPADGAWASTTNLGVAPFNCSFGSAGCTASWSAILGAFPSAKVVFGIGPNIGTGGTFSGNVDNLAIGVSGSTTVFNFEPDCTTTCYVDAAGNDLNTGQANDPLKTIQGGVNKVSSGGTVQVSAGTYVENVTVPKAVTLAGAGQTSTIIEPATSGPNPSGCGSLCPGASSVIKVQSSNVTIHDLGINGDNPALTGLAVGGADVDARNGIITDHAIGPVYNSLSVHDVTVKNVFLRGIYASTGGSFNLSSNTIDNVQGNASSIGIFNWVGAGVIANNHVSHTNDAISANHSSGTSFIFNTVTTSNSGVHTDNAGDGGGAADVVSGNNVSACTPAGYGVWTFVPYIAPTISNNTVSGCAVALAAFASCDLDSPGPTPLSLGNCPGSTVPTETFSGNTVSGGAGDTGFYVTTDGLGFGAGDVHIAADHNTFSGFDDGVYVEETGTAHSTVALTRNAIAGNTVHGVNNAGTTSVAATCNWWGSSTGPAGAGTGSGDAVTTGVGFFPWLTSSNLNSGCSAFKLNVGDASVVQGTSGKRNLVFRLTLDKVSASPVTVSYSTAEGTATAPEDFKAKSGTVTIKAGKVQALINIQVIGNPASSGNKQMTLNLSSVVGADPLRIVATGTLLNDPSATGARVGVGSVSAGEGTSGPTTRTMTFVVALAAPAVGTVTVHYSTIPGSATAADFISKSGLLTFTNGQRSKNVSISIKVDSSQEGNQTFQLQLSSPSGAGLFPAATTATGTILDDD